MGSIIKKCMILFLSILILSNYFHHEVSGLRILEEELWLKQTTNLIIQSLPRGPVPSSGASPCTNIPGGNRRGRCALAKEEKIIGSKVDFIHTTPSNSAYPNSNMVQFGIANSENNDTQMKE